LQRLRHLQVCLHFPRRDLNRCGNCGSARLQFSCCFKFDPISFESDHGNVVYLESLKNISYFKVAELTENFDRVGGRENFFHCQKCGKPFFCISHPLNPVSSRFLITAFLPSGSCYSTTLREKHCCIENSMKNNCPICYEVCPSAVVPWSYSLTETEMK
jgi:hypothetical protein